MTSIMAKRMLSDGSKKYDPEEQVTDYEQYDSLVLLMQAKLMVTKAYGNQAPQWMPPYCPQLARHRFGLDEAAITEPESILDVVREQVYEKTQVSELPPAQSVISKLPKAADNGPRSSQRGDVPELRDEEWEAIQNEMKNYAGKYRDGIAPS